MEGGEWTYRSTTTIVVFSPESGFPYSAKAERGKGEGLCTNSTSSQEKEPIMTAQKKKGVGRKEVQKAIWEKIGPPTPTQASEHSSFPQFLSAQGELGGKCRMIDLQRGRLKTFFSLPILSVSRKSSKSPPTQKDRGEKCALGASPSLPNDRLIKFY